MSSVTHAKISAKTDPADTTLVRPSDWNDNHVVLGITNSELAQMSANTVKMNNTGSLANAIDATLAQFKTWLALALSDIAAALGVTPAADKLPYFTGSGAAGLADFTAAGRALIDDTSAAAQRTTLALGSADSVTHTTLSLGTGAAGAGIPLAIRVATGDLTISVRADATGAYVGQNIYNSSGTLAASFTYGNSTVAVAVRNTFFIGPRISGEPLLFVADTGATERMRMTSAGLFGIGLTPTAQIHVKVGAAGTIGSVVQAAASATANRAEWQDSAAGVQLAVTAGGSLQFTEMTAPAAPATNSVRLYAEDNGSGKTRLMALFPTGSAVQLAIEP